MFYVYRQNNSGGFFEINDDVTQFVIIEADSDTDANSRAEKIGIYFDGCHKDTDCPCCGDRWDAAWRDDGESEPLIDGEPIATYRPWNYTPGAPFAYVYYKDGSKLVFNQERNRHHERP